jgi:hypothetical protein
LCIRRLTRVLRRPPMGRWARASARGPAEVPDRSQEARLRRHIDRSARLPIRKRHAAPDEDEAAGHGARRGG